MIIIALGANSNSPFGHPHQTFAWALKRLHAYGIHVSSQSRLYSTEPVPASAQPYYTNQVISVTAEHSPENLMKILLNIEVEAGRERRIANEVRPLDLDILIYNDVILNDEFLCIPHKRIHERRFVLLPLSDIFPNWHHPILGQNIAQMLSIAPEYYCSPMGTIPEIMGVLNVTPDSFSDGGHYIGSDMAIAHAKQMILNGADIIDIGGESTRPNANPITIDEEQRRVMPVLAHIIPYAHNYGRKVSIDTRNALTMKAAIELGVDYINDVSALTYDVDSLGIVANSSVNIILMHMRGTPSTMQTLTQYDNVTEDLCVYFEERMHNCIEAGISKERIIIDPGLGFAKTAGQNMEIIQKISQLQSLGQKILIGASRKTMIARIAGEASAEHRLGGSLAIALEMQRKAVSILRVHDVFETMQACIMTAALIKH